MFLNIQIQVTAIRMSLTNFNPSLEFDRHKLENIYKQSPAAMALWRGKDFIFEKVNPAWEAIFPDRQMLGKPFFEALPEAKNPFFIQRINQVLETGEPYAGIEMLSYIKNNKENIFDEFYYDFSYTQITDTEGKPYGVHVHAVDVTERVVSRKNLETAKLMAEKANVLKSAFLANMSHEIRTPLGVMIGFSDLISDPDTSPDTRQQYAEILKRNGTQLNLLINDILDLSKVEAGYLKVDAQVFSLKKVLDNMMSSMFQRAHDKGLKLNCHISESSPDMIVSDPMRLMQILFNIVGNAIKFTSLGEVQVMAEYAQGQLEILVKDTGLGISKSNQSDLFKPFHQADETITRKFGGTGLGLALSKRLAQLLGGDLTLVQSAIGQGSVFKLTVAGNLPSNLLIEKKQSFKEISQVSKSLFDVSVLLVEDSMDNQKLIQLMIKKTGACIDIANDGQQGLQKALTGSYDLILMDVQMPMLDGYSATEQLRQAGYQKPIIALTAHAMSDSRKKCLDVGFTDYLPKPVDAKKLIEMISNYV